MRKSLLLFLVLIGCGAAGQATAEGISADADSLVGPAVDVFPEDWIFSLRPYFFLSGLTGSFTVEPLTFPLNSSFSDLLKNVKLGAFVNFTAEKGQWGASGDFQYINLYGKSSGTLDVALDMKNIIGELDVFYRPDRAPSLRFLLGARVYSLEQTVTIEGNEIPAALATVVDPIIGAYGAWVLSDRWDFELRGDMGGFGVSSEFTYQMMALFHWDISNSIAIPFGYRILGYQIQQDTVFMNIRMSGMLLGLDIRF
jgi:hypothetical protein